MKFLKPLVIILSFLVVNVAFAEKIAVLDIQQALLTSNAAKAYDKKIKKELSSDRDKVLELEKQAKSLRKKIQSKGSSLPAADLKRLQMQFQKAFQEYQRSGQALQQVQAEREQAFLAKMQPKLDKAIRKVIDKSGFDIVLAKQATVYANKKVDITKKVIQLLNAE